MNRRTPWAALLNAMAVAVGTGAIAQGADDFPNRPIRIIVPQAAGSGVATTLSATAGCCAIISARELKAGSGPRLPDRV